MTMRVAGVEGGLLSEVAVASVPLTRRQVSPKLAGAALADIVGEEREPRHAVLDIAVEVGLGPCPKRRSESVEAIVGNGYLVDLLDVEMLAEELLVGRVGLRGKRGASGKYPRPQKRWVRRGSKKNTTWRPDTRRISCRPARRSDQRCTLSRAMAASKA